MQKLLIQGGNPLKGKVTIGGSKNAALPILAATLIATEPVRLENVPFIDDVEKMLLLLERFGVKITRGDNSLDIDASEAQYTSLLDSETMQLRGSIVIMGAALARFGEIEMDFPGGCVLGKRPVEAHLSIFEDFGAEVLDANCKLHIKVNELKGVDATLLEPSVTATENAILAAATAKGSTMLRLVATEPHVQDLCKFLNSLGAKIKGIGTPYLEIEGVESLKGGTHSITGDYLEAGTFAIAAAVVPGSEVEIQGIETRQLDALWNKFRAIGVEFELQKDSVTVKGASSFAALTKLDSRLYPYFPTDLQAPFAVLLTQADGVSKIFETLFEGRLNYLFELEKMGAKVEVLNPHQAIVIGQTSLKGTAVASCDIRAGAAIVIAALLAEGASEISNIDYIDRGYEKLDEKLRNLGADIKREEA